MKSDTPYDQQCAELIGRCNKMVLLARRMRSLALTEASSEELQDTVNRMTLEAKCIGDVTAAITI